ncbi:class I SAM-dependent methyltransferase [Mycobacterium asiaticum]|uniref:Ubiquinone biosynthesis methyltransferase UbiE n=1 Tax=Mycobacterium asiaticum TaxID=1790 RepID=A0A1A3KIS7_MYCAS|nr:ubiquinone biosynthesis methyltransferase UbiE [Mycobacterium asiaticum]OBJ84920.1 ubiquinone biosynthesis methyltransferase UbiE [Mycobacterium asiaticum]
MKKSGLARSDVPEAFDVGADAYDQLVGANPGYHANLRLSVSRMNLPDRGRGLRLLDAGCGTGASTAALVQAAPEAEIVAVDAAAGMLHAAQAKSWPESVRFVHTRIEDLHEHGITGPFDGILAAYLLRNLANPDAQLRTFTTLLRPGATLAVHEYSVRDSPAAQRIWHAVCWGIIIPAGWWRTRSTTLYRHLWRSVLSFDGAARFRQRMIDAGFSDVRSETVPGWERNIVHTFIGRAPEAPVGPEGKASP